MEIARRRGDFAIVGVAAIVTLDEARRNAARSGWHFAASAKPRSMPAPPPTCLIGQN